MKEWIKILLNTLLIESDPDSKKDGKRLKEIMISDHEWDLLVDLKEILSLFAEATTELGGSKYVTNSLRVRILIEIIKTLTTNSSDNSIDIDEQEDAFEDEENQGNFNINEPVLTFGLLDEVKSKLYKNLKKYYPTLTTETLIPSILDPRFKSLDFAFEEQKFKTEQHLHELFKKEKENQKEISNTFNIPSTSKPKKKKTLMERLTKDNTVAFNEVNEYLQLSDIPLDLNPLSWWNEKKDKFPILCSLAQKYLAVSATSTASERLFSDAGNLLTNKRTRMKPKLFKKIMFLKRNASNFETIYPDNH